MASYPATKKLPTSPPAGFYDPALDAQQRASSRGLSQYLQDLGTQGSRSESDYLLGTNQAATQTDRSLQDLLREHNQFGQDVQTSQAREGQDYQTQLNDLARSFQRLGQSQAQSATARGLSSGALVKAMRARAANQQIQTQPLATAHERFNQDVGQKVSRENEAYTTNVDRANQDYSSQVAELGRQFQYGADDRSLAATRAQLEDTAFGQDIGAQRLYQAGQAGWTIPTPPKKKKT